MSRAVARPGPRMHLCLAVACASVVLAANVAPAQTSPPSAAVPAAAPPVAAQSPDANAPLPTFDVVSVKPHKDEGMSTMRIGISTTPDGFQADGVPLQLLMRQAFGLSEDRILGEPDWAKSARFDINAKVAPEDAPKLKGLSGRQRAGMLLPMLQERFGLKYHHETRELQVYALVVGKGGPKLKEYTPPAGGDSASVASMPPPPPPPPGPGGAAGGGASMGPQGANGPRTMISMSEQGMRLEAHGSTMAGLAQIISQQISATVVDKTELTGRYDYTLAFTPDMGGAGGLLGAMRPPPSGGTPDSAQAQDPVGPSIFTAVQEQLGLRLETRKESEDVIVIDRLEQPSEN